MRGRRGSEWVGGVARGDGEGCDTPCDGSEIRNRPGAKGMRRATKLRKR